MSFGKAKIHRFNDIKPHVPKPAPTCNAEKKSKGKSAVVPQFDNCKEGSSSVAENASTKSTPCFKTPAVPAKKKVPVKSKNQPGLRETINLEALTEKIIECKNKDAYIKDLMEQIEDMNDTMSNLKKQKQQLDLDKMEFEETINKLKTEHGVLQQEMIKKFETDLCTTVEEKNRMANDILLAKAEYEHLQESNRQEMIELKKNCDKFQLIYKKSIDEQNKLIDDKNRQIKYMEDELKNLERISRELETKHLLDIEKLRKEHQIEIQDIEFEMLKTMSELEKEKEIAACKLNELEVRMNKDISEMRSKFEKEKDELVSKSEAELKQVEENCVKAKLLAETELKEQIEQIKNEYLQKLEDQQNESGAILKECQAISEYSIIQSELEKNKIHSDLMNTTKELENVKTMYHDIVYNYEMLNKRFSEVQSELSDAVANLKATKNNLNEDLERTTKQVNQLSKENTAYKFTIKNSQVTIDVLKKRLIHSDNDVEQLKNELVECEKYMLEYEYKYLQLLSDLKQAQTVNQELETEHESMIKQTCTEIEERCNHLNGKVDFYKAQVEAYIRKIEEEKDTRKETVQQLHDAHELINKLEVNLDYLKTMESQYEFEIDQSQNELEDYHIREIDWNVIKDKLENSNKEMENLLQAKQSEISDLKKELDRLQEKSGPDVQCSEYYENKLKEYEQREIETENIREKYIELEAKFNELSQEFVELQLDNLKNINKVTKLKKEVEEKNQLEEKYNKQKESFDKLTKKYENLVKEKLNNNEDKNARLEKLDLEQAEKDKLSGRVRALENELKEVSQKYAELAGHQNNKQKIKHLVDLKTKNEELVQKNNDLEIQLQSHAKTLDKVKKENWDLKKCLRKSKHSKEDKENMCSPNRSQNSSRIESPFRDRN